MKYKNNGANGIVVFSNDNACMRQGLEGKHKQRHEYYDFACFLHPNPTRTYISIHTLLQAMRRFPFACGQCSQTCVVMCS